jgi:hypothetical protein
MGEIMLKESTLKFLEDIGSVDQDLDAKVRALIETEYMRRIGAYARTNQAMQAKYGMSFEEFVERQVVKERGFTWEVEKDAMEWEMAFSGYASCTRKLKELRSGGILHSA